MDWVGLGHKVDGLDWIGFRKLDPRPTLCYTFSLGLGLGLGLGRECSGCGLGLVLCGLVNISVKLERIYAKPIA